ncbi:hypothetical protein Vid5_gp86 [Pantoea phage vB_PagS_Vid5]|uniref:Uncharacterized protein n=1 Tax=Pantoea phage vB_PagS_Vid5 TaxID=2099652 RepID=A0A2P1CKQ3_9CAUD|nr:hypothetical protein FDJ45_gp069 [Pantoea phage vB_PagS_Vid5]AVJ51841.1 hypothetical protein Vid5_gp86 [Pantoea phage vB_PagS_Vid5]
MSKEDAKAFLFRPRKQDSLIGVSAETIDKLCEATGMNKTELLHYALVRMANEYNLRPLTVVDK